MKADDLTSQQTNALNMIKETADSICYTVEQRGSETDKEISGKIDAKVTGVLSRLAEMGASGSAQIKSENYQGVVRDQLSSALMHSASCKNNVFHALVEKMVPSLARAVPVAPGLPATNQLPSPKNTAMTETTQTRVQSSTGKILGVYKIQYYKCGTSNSKESLTCLLAISYQAKDYEDQYVDYTVDPGDSIGVARFIDNLGIQHRGAGAHFINGRGQRQQTINMERDVPVWLALEFEGPFNDVSSGRIVFKDGRAMLQIRSVSKQ